jgi:FMN phosphatase YigB (HAD superfamily)
VHHAHGRYRAFVWAREVKMIQVVMFDLGMTLVDADDKPFPHVADALAAISAFKTSAGKPLKSCLVSDFTMPTAPVTAKKIKALFDEYLAILDSTGLRPSFEPVNKRITLSTHAGASKPNRKVFEKALQRLGVSVPFEECLFITENTQHIDSVRGSLHMKVLQFRPADNAHDGFDDWSKAPALIAPLVGLEHTGNTHASIKAFLAAKDIDLVESHPNDGQIKFSGRAWSPISVPGFEDLQNIHVALPVRGEASLGAKGEVSSVKLDSPSTEEIAEAASYVQSLAKHGQIATDKTEAKGSTTHEVVVDKKGTRRLMRKRFTAL